MHRRDFIHGILGTMATLPTASAFADVVAGYQPDRSSTVLDSNDHHLMAQLTECIIPETDSPGAKSAGVPDFIEHLLGSWYNMEDQQRFTAGLATIDQTFQRQHQVAFHQATTETRLQLLSFIEAEQRETEQGLFLQWIKELTVLGYYTSEVGATRELTYLAVPGPYRGCIDVKEVGRTWAL